MEYNIQKYMKTIELDKVLEMLAEKTACEDAADVARNLIPVTEIEEVQQMLSETDTAYQMMARFGAPSFYGLQQIVNSLRRAQSGGVLNLAEFLSIAGVLRAMRGIVQWRKKSEGLQTILDWRFDCLTSNPYLEDKINQTVASEEEVADTASPALTDIRRKNASCFSKGTGTIRQHDTFQCISKVFAGSNCYYARRTLCGAGKSGISRGSARIGA